MGFDREGGGPRWCDDTGGAPNCAFRPQNMVEMLESQRDVGLTGGLPTYNEVIVDRRTWESWLPRSIEAVWYLKSGHCKGDGTMLCEDFARRVHGQLIREFKIDEDDLPLLVFDPW